MQKIRKGDEVIVIAVKDKGRRGVVQQRVGRDRVVVAGINVVKKHVRPNPLKGDAGGIVSKEMPIHISNVMLYNPKTQKGERVGIKTLEDGRKVRFFKRTGELVDA